MLGSLKTILIKTFFLGNAKALIIPSIFNEPFGMVMIEALACGTPIIGLDSGAIPEIVNANNGILVDKSENVEDTITGLSKAINDISNVNRLDCRRDFENRFTLDTMCRNYADTYRNITK